MHKNLNRITSMPSLFSQSSKSVQVDLPIKKNTKVINKKNS